MSIATIVREIRFEAAHFLPRTPDGHKCRNLHGHSYAVEVHVTGEIDEASGWVCDFDDLRQAFEPLRRQLDHRVLNEVDGLANATSENLARWIWTQLVARLPGLSAVVVQETCTSKCIFRG